MHFKMPPSFLVASLLSTTFLAGCGVSPGGGVMATGAGSAVSAKAIYWNDFKILDPQRDREEQSWTLLIRQIAQSRNFKEIMRNWGDLYARDLNKRTFAGETALSYAVQVADGEFVRFLIAKGAETKGQESHLLQMAAWSHNAPALESLLGAGLKVDHEDSFGRTALFRALQPSNVTAPKGMETLTVLLEAGADPNHRLQEKGFGVIWQPGDTPFTYAVEWYPAPLVELMLRHGASLRVTNGNGKNAQDIASARMQEAQKRDYVKQAEAKAVLDVIQRAAQGKL